MSHPLIQLDEISRWFGTTCAVNQLSFHVDAGTVFGFIGPNGAGKTTSMRILSTLDTPTSGHAWVDGFSVVEDPDRVRQRLGFMPDHFGTYPNTTCEEYLDFFARAYGLRGSERRQALREVMGFTQLDRLAQKPVEGLSKGMRQRLCLGRALIHDPKVLILDEPAAGLDPRARIELREMICALADRGKALLVSSHILTELAEMCDRVAIIEQGKLLAVGTVDEILQEKNQELDSAGEASTTSASKVQITVVDNVEKATNWLISKGFDPLPPDSYAVKNSLPNPSTAERILQIEHSGSELERAQLLSDMIAEGFMVSGFSIKQRSLEDAFLQVTRGHVQ